MRYASLSGRLVVIGPEGGAVDVNRSSAGRFSADPQSVYDDWDGFRAWASSVQFDAAEAFDPAELDAPVPMPRQLFAIGLNYLSHAKEVGKQANSVPPVFTKFVSSITGPRSDVVHPGGDVDWEVELVVVIGREARNVAREDAWSFVAGLTAGQDISERILQHEGLLPKFSLGKSYPGFAPMGPWVVTIDEFDDPDDLELECWVNDRLVQKARTSEMILPVSDLISKLSSVTPLLPGDVIFTGTPAGVGLGQVPPWFLKVGDSLRTSIGQIGELHNSVVASPQG